MATSTTRPWLLYAYPWMPYPRRISIYLSEKRIPANVINIVHVSDPQSGNAVVASQANDVPPRPAGSLPILAMPPTQGRDEWLYIRQSMAIINFVEEACESGGELSGVSARAMSRGTTALKRARLCEIQTLAEEVMVAWNPVRMFGTKAGTIVYPEGAKEMLRWVHRTLATLDQLFSGRDLSGVVDDEKPVSVADVVLFGFLDFVDYCYGVDVTKGSGEEKVDVYGRTVKETYEFLNDFYENFKKRKSARRDGEGEMASEGVKGMMRGWHEGVL